MRVENIETALTSVTKTYTNMRKQEERARQRVCRSDYMYSDRVTVKEVAWDVMEAAYNKVSDNGRLPANARQIMYAARPEILARADKSSFGDSYFTQTLLPEYIAEHGCSWDVVYDARGHLIEPHTEEKIALGTIDVRNYLRGEVESDVGYTTLKLDYPTKGPANRFGAVLFIEKEGFHPLFQEVKLAEKWDIAIMSTKGMSVTAARDLIGSLGVPVYVLHDFDKAGFSIVGTMQRGTRRYPHGLGNVIDMGLRFEDVKKYDLVSEPAPSAGSDWTVRGNLLDNGATDAEIEFLLNERVELNAFASDVLIEWIEDKLTEHGIKKVVPDDDTLKQAYRRAAYTSYVNEQIADIDDEAKEHAEDIAIPNDLGEQVQARLQDDPRLPWDRVLVDILETP